MLKRLLREMQKHNMDKVGKQRVPQDVWHEAEQAGATFKGYVAHERVEHIFFDKLKTYVEKEDALKQADKIITYFKLKLRRKGFNKLEIDVFEKIFKETLTNYPSTKINAIYNALTNIDHNIWNLSKDM